MKNVTAACLVLVVLAAPFGAAQQSQPQTGQTARGATAQSAQELYHVHFVKSAPGKLRELIDSYVAAPTDPSNPERPLILRHVQGDDWDLLVLQPLGTEETLRATPPTAEQQQFITRNRGLRMQHNDTFATGPAWSEARSALLSEAPSSSSGVPTGTGGSAPTSEVYAVTVYRALPGHRDQLWQVLTRIANLTPGRTTTLQHLEGAPWDFIAINRFDSWEALGAPLSQSPERLKSQGFATDEGPAMELREHVAEHRDTIATRVTGGTPKPVK